MSTTYKVTVNEQVFEFSKEDLINLDITGFSSYHILDNHKAHQATITSANFNEKTIDVQINGNDYTVQIADEYDQLVERMGLSKVDLNQVNDIKAPMPGLVLSIEVAVGQTVEKGTPLLILEAMKMENVLKSQGEGTVKSIEVKQGVAVDKGQLLIEMA